MPNVPGLAARWEVVDLVDRGTDENGLNVRDLVVAIDCGGQLQVDVIHVAGDNEAMRRLEEWRERRA